MVVQIIIRCLTGEVYTVKLDDTEFQGATVLDLKHKIAALKGTPEDEQRLVFAGKQLEDDFLLSGYGIQDDDTIHMVLRRRGGRRPGGPGDPGLGDKDGKNRSKEKLCDF